MSETKQLIEQLNGRVDKLISRIAESNQQAEKKQAEIVSLTEQIRQKDLTIAALQEELTTVKQAQLAASSTENDELKGRINEMVREIDECISLLNVGN
ncbi:MAG: hypothetical protein IPO32_04040 [Crocinitomicaceae bacterium]|nr:hypothetical protein [Crocinitomicaceae bacterium]